MDYRTLEITILSAEGIKNVNTFGKMNVYAVAQIFGYPQSKKTTRVDKQGGTNPNWNERLEFTVDERSLSNPGMAIVIQLKADKSFRPDKNIGEVVVPIPELFTSGSDAGASRVVDYQVRTSSGKPKGTLKFSYKFGEKVSYNNNNNAKVGGVDEPVLAYPAGYKQGQAGVGMAEPTMAYPGPGHPGMGYQQPHPGMGYQQPAPAGYPGYSQPPPPGYGAYPSNPGYGYAPPPAGYGYQQPPMQAPKKKKNGMGMGLGLGAGLLGGMLIGDMVSDYGEMAAYNDGYGDAMGDMGDFDF